MTDQIELNRFTPTDRKSGEPIKLAMQQLWLSGRIVPAGAIVEVRHLFRVDAREPAEVIYAFGLPRDAALRRFRVVGDGFEVASKLLPVSEAQQLYEAGLEQGSLAALTTQYQDGIINLSVGNLRPGEDVAVYLEIVTGVDVRDNGARFRFPFTLAPGYHPKAVLSATGPGRAEMELPEAQFGDLILPEWRKHPEGLHEVGFDLNIDWPGPLTETGSPSHNIRVTQQQAGTTRVSLATGGDVPDRDLILDLAGQVPATTITAHAAADSDARFVGVIPSTHFGVPADRPRRVVFVMDRSGSMEGKPIEQAKQALEACLAALAPRDQFGVVFFDNLVDQFDASMRSGTTRDRKAVSAYLRKVDARGGTELAAGVEAGAKLLGADGGDILLLTDGQVFGTDHILNGLRNTAVRIHSLGIGSAAPDRLLVSLARLTGGASRCVTPRERVDLAAAELFASISQPVARELSGAFEGGEGKLLVPLPDAVYQGHPLVLYGQCNDTAGKGCIALRWRNAAGAPETLSVPVQVVRSDQYDCYRLLQGARLIADIDAELDSTAGGAVDKRRERRAQARLEKLSLAYGLASRAASLVAVIRREGDQALGLPTTVVVPVGLPQDTILAGGFDSDTSLCFSVTPSAAPRAGADVFGRNLLRSRPRRVSFMTLTKSLFGSNVSPESVTDLDDVDRLMASAAKLESDGGMPGRDVQERILRSLIALLALAAWRERDGSAAFDLHIERLGAFLSVVETAGMKDGQADAIARSCQLCARGRTPPGSWLEWLRQSDGGLQRSRRDAFWQELGVALGPHESIDV